MSSDNYVRVVILNYNESTHTVNLVHQLQDQEFNNFEIIIVDNKSRDSEVEILKKIRESEKIKIIYADQNKGYSTGNNLGLRYKSSKKIDYCLILNNDLIIEDPSFISKMIEGMSLHNSCNVVASSPIIDDIYNKEKPLEERIQVRRILKALDFFLISIPLLKPFLSKKINFFIYKKQLPYLDKYMLCDSINGAAFMISHDFLLRNNYLDEGTFLYNEEIILGKQIKNDNKTCLLNGHVQVKHLQGLSTKSNSNKHKINVKMERFKYQSSLYYLKKYESMGTIPSLLFIFLSEFSIILKKVLKR